MDPNSLESVVGRHDSSQSSKDLARSKEKQSPQAQVVQTQQKKQVRRRIHSTKSYQGRVMNMAEARREIVTALRIHRSLMKENETHRSQMHSTSQQDYPSTSSFLTENSHGEMNSRRTTMIYPSTDCNPLTHSCSFRNNFTVSNSYPPDVHGSTDEVGIVHEKLNVTLPSRYPVGLDSSNHRHPCSGFTNKNSNSHIFSSYSLTFDSSTILSSSSTSYSHSSSTMVPVHESTNEGNTATLHPVMDAEKMAEIQSIGERHSVEWNDELNLTTMLWWYEFLNASEASPSTSEGNHDGQGEPEEAEEITHWTSEEQQLDLCTPHVHCKRHDPMFPWQ